ncbi:WAS/WASL-interacting protein family member 2-like [Symphalangus syndactylus]|uniref:WAS/WASL-interacting protein family member 2-like n=1 Tax=Symphalangus syndactylus TaxID=9590 RepID=UPI00244246C4|nr:WAS/WASL-interacting protein family member 2-like [Symphalangus syndactylus]
MNAQRVNNYLGYEGGQSQKGPRCPAPSPPAQRTKSAHAHIKRHAHAHGKRHTLRTRALCPPLQPVPSPSGQRVLPTPCYKTAERQALGLDVYGPSRAPELAFPRQTSSLLTETPSPYRPFNAAGARGPSPPPSSSRRPPAFGAARGPPGPRPVLRGSPATPRCVDPGARDCFPLETGGRGRTRRIQSRILLPGIIAPRAPKMVAGCFQDRGKPHVL